jgi:hypothetical protein
MVQRRSNNSGCLTFAGLFFGVIFSCIVLWWIYTGEIHTRHALTTLEDQPVKFVIMTGLLSVFALFSLAIAVAGLTASFRRK